MLLLLWLTHIMVPVVEAQQVNVGREVTGYLGHDVILTCQFIPGPHSDIITEVQWELQPPGGENILIIVSNFQSVKVHESFLKERVEFTDKSLIIRDVEKRDAGSYSCIFTVFPSGFFTGTTNLVVKDLEAQQVNVGREVTGYLGHDAILPCQFVPGTNADPIIQIQWELQPPGGENILIIASNLESVTVHESFLKERVEFTDKSLIIRDVEKRDAGLYSCSVTIFPSGSLTGTTNLVVQEVLLIYPKIITGGVFMLIVGTMLTTTCFISRKREKDTDGPVTESVEVNSARAAHVTSFTFTAVVQEGNI